MSLCGKKPGKEKEKQVEHPSTSLSLLKCLVMSPHQPRLQEQPMQLPHPSPALPFTRIPYHPRRLHKPRINTPSQQNVRTHHLPFLMQLLRFHAATRIGVAGIQPMRNHKRSLKSTRTFRETRYSGASKIRSAANHWQGDCFHYFKTTPAHERMGQ